MDTMEKILEMMEKNKEITEKIKKLAETQRDLIDNLLFIQILEVEEDKEDDSA